MTVVFFRVKDWATEGRDDEQRAAFLGELIRRLWAASIAGNGELLPEAKKEIVAAVVAEHWTRQPELTTTKGDSPR
jgi:hypothetical protein